MSYELFFFFWHYSVDRETEKEEAQTKLNAALQEKEQVANDLNSMERSFSDLFKRLEKYKEIVEGYKKVRIYKSCAIMYSVFSGKL